MGYQGARSLRVEFEERFLDDKDNFNLELLEVYYSWGINEQEKLFLKFFSEERLEKSYFNDLQDKKFQLETVQILPDFKQDGDRSGFICSLEYNIN